MTVTSLLIAVSAHNKCKVSRRQPGGGRVVSKEGRTVQY